MKKGFTLIEVMVATLILSVLLSALLSPFVDILRFSRETEGLDEAFLNVRNTMNILEKELRTATNVTYAADRLSFVTQEGSNIAYTFSTDGLFKENASGEVEELTGNLNTDLIQANVEVSSTVAGVTVVHYALVFENLDTGAVLPVQSSVYAFNDNF